MLCVEEMAEPFALHAGAAAAGVTPPEARWNEAMLFVARQEVLLALEGPWAAAASPPGGARPVAAGSPAGPLRAVGEPGDCSTGGLAAGAGPGARQLLLAAGGR